MAESVLFPALSKMMFVPQSVLSRNPSIRICRASSVVNVMMLFVLLTVAPIQDIGHGTDGNPGMLRDITDVHPLSLLVNDDWQRDDIQLVLFMKNESLKRISVMLQVRLSIAYRRVKRGGRNRQHPQKILPAALIRSVTYLNNEKLLHENIFSLTIPFFQLRRKR